MTNKNEMPVVANRYRHKINEVIYKAFKHPTKQNRYFMESQSPEALDLVAYEDDFWSEYEELLDQTSVGIDEVKVNGVEEALKQLKYHVGITQYFDKEAALDDIKEVAKNLINALEANGNKQEETKKETSSKCADCGKTLGAIGCKSSFKLGIFCSIKCAENPFKQEKSKSLWKDVSEAKKEYELDQGVLILARHDGGQITLEDIEKIQEDYRKHEECCIYNDYVTLTDFINSFEQLQRDVEEIKGKIK